MPLCLEFLVLPDGLDGPAAAMVDLLRLLNQVAQSRGARHPPLAWQWTDAQGHAVRRRATPPRRRGLPDALVVPGWATRSGPHLDRLVARDAAVLGRLRAVHAAGGHVMGLYTGVALLGAAGLLAGRPVVVPWPFIPSVLRHAPDLQLHVDGAWVEHQRVWSADSPALATELALQLLRALGQADLAEAGASVVLHRSERQRLVAAVARDSGSRIGPGTIERARRWLEAHLHEPYDLAATAQAAATSTRSLLRHFKASEGRTPLELLHELRVTRARMLLETTYLPVDQVAERCGWRDVAMLREVFRRATGVTPAAYRGRFRLRAERRRWGRDLA